MINELLKSKVRKQIENILSKIDWPPEKLCELAVRVALAVSKSRMGFEFRAWAKFYLDNNPVNCFEMWLKLRDASLNLEKQEVFESIGYELRSAHDAYSQWFHGFSKGQPEEKLFLLNALVNAKLAAITRGEKLEISEIIKEMEGKHATSN